MKKIVIILSIILLASCSINRAGKYDYTVEAGHHYANFTPLIFLSSNIISYDFTPDSSWIWPKPERNGWSKLTGIAWGHNHENSVRLVYMRINDNIGVFGYYAYVNGISPQQNTSQKGIMDTIVIGKKYHGTIGWSKGNYFVMLNNRTDSIRIGDVKGMKTLSRPYIGGTYTIKNDWNVTLTYKEQ